MRGSVRYGVVIGSATAVLLLAATSALVFRGGLTPRSEPPQLQAAAVTQGEPMPPPAATARPPVLIPERPISPGNRLLSAEASNGAGGGTIKSEETVALSINPAAPAERAGET